MSYPADSHVHTEWSWDASDGSMQRSCARAVELGLPSIAFTEHVDHTVWTTSLAGIARLPRDHPVSVRSDRGGRVTPPPFDSAGYLEAVERCRERFPALRILSGLELGEPHWHWQAISRVLASGPFDRILAAWRSRGRVSPGFRRAPRRPTGAVRTSGRRGARRRPKSKRPPEEQGEPRGDSEE